ncbi:MAG: hypothetical protein OEV40_19270 [Acidimicrobiia bacterium]|nr:hypothetical protein [Acidimicrobiia bacterium]
MGATMSERWLRAALGYLTLFSLQVGVWALVAPQSFYDDFPGFGRVWVSVDGPYNEHLIRDVGALNLALAVVFVAAAVTLSRALILTAAGAAAVWGLPHLLYHLLNTDGLSGGDLVASLGGLVLFAAVPAALVVLSRRPVIA